MTNQSVQPWRVESSEILTDCRIFKVRKEGTVSPRTGQRHEMFVLDSPNWLNVVPLTSEEQVVLVEQWRHGTRSNHLETPGGLIELGETIEQCARRELLEETGYQPETIVSLGSVHPNPAIQNNVQHYVLATNCCKISELVLDAEEDIAVHLVPLTQIPLLIQSGKITNSLVVGAFYWLDVYRRKLHGATH